MAEVKKYIYRNQKTGAVITTSVPFKGANWEEVKTVMRTGKARRENAVAGDGKA